MIDNRVIARSPPTRCTSLTHHGGYAKAEVWANKCRYMLTFDRYLNLVSIKRFVLSKDHAYLNWWHWRQEFNRGYKRKSSLGALHVDLVVCALESARRWRLARRVKEL